MNFSRFFSEQARKPTGFFGLWMMSVVFDKGNSFLNGFVEELMSVQADDHILEIGFGTGKLIHDMAKDIHKGYIEGIEFSSSMVSLAKKRNKKFIADEKVKIIEGNFNDLPLKNNRYTKVCTINTIYFLSNPKNTASKIENILAPEGKLFLAFEDKRHLEERSLDSNVFRLYSTDDIKNLLVDAGFSSDVGIETRVKGKLLYHCVIAKKLKA